jgi:hypothetical protein
MGFFDAPGPRDIENWVCIMERGTEYEVVLARNYLSNLKIPSNILSKRDSAYSLNIGETSMVYLYVPKEFEAKARKALSDLDDADFEGPGQGWDNPDDDDDDDDEGEP